LKEQNRSGLSLALQVAFLTLKNPKRCTSVIKIVLFLILNEAQHVSGDTPPIIRNLKLHQQSLVLHIWKVVGRAAVGQRPTTARPTTFHVCKTRGCWCSF
jgi:hypothetical protein